MTDCVSRPIGWARRTVIVVSSTVGKARTTYGSYPSHRRAATCELCVFENGRHVQAGCSLYRRTATCNSDSRRSLRPRGGGQSAVDADAPRGGRHLNGHAVATKGRSNRIFLSVQPRIRTGDRQDHLRAEYLEAHDDAHSASSGGRGSETTKLCRRFERRGNSLASCRYFGSAQRRIRTGDPWLRSWRLIPCILCSFLRNGYLLWPTPCGLGPFLPHSAVLWPRPWPRCKQLRSTYDSASTESKAHRPRGSK